MSLTTEQQSRQSGPILSAPLQSRDLPDWFLQQQRSAWQKFESVPRTTRKDQPWRFSNVDLLDLKPSNVPGPLSHDDPKNTLKSSVRLKQLRTRMLFANT